MYNVIYNPETGKIIPDDLPIVKQILVHQSLVNHEPYILFFVGEPFVARKRPKKEQLQTFQERKHDSCQDCETTLEFCAKTMSSQEQRGFGRQASCRLKYPKIAIPVE
jgi:hypothetical protein